MIVTPVWVSPLAMAHWMGAAPRYFGKQRSMHVQYAVARHIDDVLRNDLAIADDHHHVRSPSFERFQVFSAADAFGLKHLNAQSDGRRS